MSKPKVIVHESLSAVSPQVAALESHLKALHEKVKQTQAARKKAKGPAKDALKKKIISLETEIGGMSEKIAQAKKHKSVSADRSTAKPLPDAVVAVQEWQSASTRLDYELAQNLKKAGVTLTFVDGTDFGSGYGGAIISTKKLTAPQIKYINDNLSSYVE